MDLLQAYKNATEQDLENINKQIKEHETTLDGLKQLQKSLQRKLGKYNKPKTKYNKKPTELAEQIIALINNNGGSQQIPILANQLSKTEQAIKTAISRNPKYLNHLDGIAHTIPEP